MDDLSKEAFESLMNAEPIKPKSGEDLSIPAGDPQTLLNLEAQREGRPRTPPRKPRRHDMDSHHQYRCDCGVVYHSTLAVEFCQKRLHVPLKTSRG